MILALYLHLVHETEHPQGDVYFILTVFLVIFLSSVAKQASSGTSIIVQKDWIVVMSEGDGDFLAGEFHLNVCSIQIVPDRNCDTGCLASELKE